MSDKNKKDPEVEFYEKFNSETAQMTPREREMELSRQMTPEGIKFTPEESRESINGLAKFIEMRDRGFLEKLTEAERNAVANILTIPESVKEKAKNGTAEITNFAVPWPLERKDLN